MREITSGGLFVTIVAAAVLGGAPMSAQPDQMSGSAKGVRDALRSGGIAAAAALEGHYKATISAHPENNVENLGELVDWHDLIVVGRVGQTNRGWLTADGETVVTDYDFRVEEVLKGRATPVITVSILGGRVSFPNGSTATLTSTMVAPVPGERYLFFLVPTYYPVGPRQLAAAHGRPWTLQHLSLGAFFLPDSRGVVPRARAGHPLREAYHDMEQMQFLQLVRKLARAVQQSFGDSSRRNCPWSRRTSATRSR